MNQNQNCCFGSKEQITDLLSSEKFLASNYNAFLLESATPEVLQTMTVLLSDTQDMQHRLFTEMQSRGWYQTTKADDQKVAAAKAQHAVAVTQ